MSRSGIGHFPNKFSKTKNPKDLLSIRPLTSTSINRKEAVIKNYVTKLDNLIHQRDAASELKHLINKKRRNRRGNIKSVASSMRCSPVAAPLTDSLPQKLSLFSSTNQGEKVVIIACR